MPVNRQPHPLMICSHCGQQLVCDTTLRVLDFNVGKEGTRITEPGLWMTTLASRMKRPKGQLSVGCATYPVERTVRPDKGRGPKPQRTCFRGIPRTLR